jgi:hypothetical protein
MRELPDIRNTGQSCRHLRFLERASELTHSPLGVCADIEMLQQRLTGRSRSRPPGQHNEATGEDPRILRIAAAIDRKIARDEIKRMRAAKDEIASNEKNA